MCTAEVQVMNNDNFYKQIEILTLFLKPGNPKNTKKILDLENGTIDI